MDHRGSQIDILTPYTVDTGVGAGARLERESTPKPEPEPELEHERARRCPCVCRCKTLARACSRVLSRRPSIIAVGKQEPKTQFANERTFIQYMSASVLLLTASTWMTGTSPSVAKMLIVASVVILAYACGLYFWRKKQIDRRGNAEGPASFGIALLSACIGTVLVVSLLDRFGGGSGGNARTARDLCVPIGGDGRTQVWAPTFELSGLAYTSDGAFCGVSNRYIHCLREGGGAGAGAGADDRFELPLPADIEAITVASAVLSGNDSSGYAYTYHFFLADESALPKARVVRSAHATRTVGFSSATQWWFDSSAKLSWYVANDTNEHAASRQSWENLSFDDKRDALLSVTNTADGASWKLNVHAMSDAGGFASHVLDVSRVAGWDSSWCTFASPCVIKDLAIQNQDPALWSLWMIDIRAVLWRLDLDPDLVVRTVHRHALTLAANVEALTITNSQRYLVIGVEQPAQMYQIKIADLDRAAPNTAATFVLPCLL